MSLQFLFVFDEAKCSIGIEMGQIFQIRLKIRAEKRTINRLWLDLRKKTQ